MAKGRAAWGRRAWAVVVLAWAVVPGVWASEAAGHGAAEPPAGLVSEGHLDWATGQFDLTLTLPLPPDPDANPPQRRYRAELAAQAVAAQEFVRRAGEIPAASGRTLADLAAEDPTVEAGLIQAGEALKFVSSRVDEAYQSLEMVWSTPVWPTLAPLADAAAEANPVPEPLGWASSRDFSGLVIFAMGDLAWKGTALKARWTPSMTFRLLNPAGEVLFDPSMVDLGALTQWGQAAFSLGKFNETPVRDRIGFDPLRIVARGVWGAHAGDLILAQADWDRILARPANRQLLAQGRVLVLYGPFPDYKDYPNPDSAIDESKPAVEVIPEPPVETAPAAAAGH